MVLAVPITMQVPWVGISRSCARSRSAASPRPRGATPGEDAALAAAVAWWFKPSALPLALGFAAAALAGDLYMHYAVFIAPKGSVALNCTSLTVLKLVAVYTICLSWPA